MVTQGVPGIEIRFWRDQKSWELVPEGTGVDLGRVFPAGSEQLVYFHIRNSGDSLLTVSEVSMEETEGVQYGPGVSADGFELQELDPYELSFIKPGEGVFLAIQFTALRFGSFQSTLQIESNLSREEPDGTKVPLKILVESDNIWDHVPSVFPKEELTYLGDKRFTSDKFGSFEVDTRIENQIVHSVLGPGRWWKEGTGFEIQVDTDLWGKLWTSFHSANPAYNGPLFQMWSYYHQKMYVMDLSGEHAEPFRYLLEFNSQYPEGWFSYLELPLSDAEGFYSRAEESFEEVIFWCSVFRSAEHDISGKSLFQFQQLKQMYGQFQYFSRRCKSSVDYLRLETSDTVQIATAEELKEKAKALELRAAEALSGVYDPPDQTFQLSDGVTLDVLHISNGRGWIGSPEGEAGRDIDEQRIFWTLDHPFAIGLTEVTQRQWVAVMGTNPSYQVEGDNLDYPVNNVSYFEAMEFCRLLTEKLTKAHAIEQGTLVRLPTEIEWEFAARFGTWAAWAFGNMVSSEYCNIGAPYLYDPYNPGSHTVPPHLDAPAPVMSFSGDYSLCGAYDFMGNVSEWCVNDYAPDYKTLVSPDPGYPAVVKGGSWKKDPFSARFAHREPATRTERAEDLGFRVVLIPGP